MKPFVTKYRSFWLIVPFERYPPKRVFHDNNNTNLTLGHFPYFATFDSGGGCPQDPGCFQIKWVELNIKNHSICDSQLISIGTRGWCLFFLI